VRELSARELNRALLARQLLLERARLPLPRAVERMGGVQAQYAPSTYIGLWSRVHGLEREHATRALERRSLVQGTLMRVTIHVVSARDYWPLALAIRDERRRWWLRTHRNAPAAGTMQSGAARLRRALAKGPLSRAEIAERFAAEPAVFNGLGLWLDLVRVPPAGTWERRRADLYAAAEDWIGPPHTAPDKGLDLLVRRYLGAFGPATASSIASWASLTAEALAPALERLSLRRFRDEEGNELLDLPRAPLPPGDAPAPPRFLPTWDATLLAHARRTRILPEHLRPLVFNTKTPHSAPTFLVDGGVAGTWRVERTKTAATLRMTPFEPLPRAARRALVEEGETLVRFHEPHAHAYRVRV